MVSCLPSVLDIPLQFNFCWICFLFRH